MPRSWIWLVVAALAIARTAHGDVTWDAPASCPDRAALLARIEAELGRAVEVDRVQIAGRITAVGHRWRLVLIQGDGERVIEAARCDELTATAALIVAMALEATREASPRPAPPATPGLDEEEPPPRGLALTTPTVTRRPVDPDRGLGVRIRAAAGGDLGGMPSLATGLGIGIEIGEGAWSLDVSASYWLSQRAFSEPAAGARVDLATAAVRGCRRLLGRDAWRGSVCAGAELDRMRDRPFGFNVPAADQPLLGGGVVAGAALGRRIAGPVWLRLDAGATGMLARLGYREGDPDAPDMLGPAVHHMRWVVLRGFVSAEVRVP